LEHPGRVPVLKGGSDLAQVESPPAEDEILRALSRVPASVPGVLDVSRDDIQVVTERVVKRVDPPRMFPLVRRARPHHQVWKCTVSYTQTVRYSYPFPTRTQRARVEVVYIDKDYLVLAR